MTYFILAEGRDEDQLADLDDRIYRPLEDDRPPTDAERAQMLADMNLPVQVVHQ